MTGRPPLTWDDLKNWAIENGVPGEAVLIDQQGREVTRALLADCTIFLPVRFNVEAPLTWHALKRWAQGTRIPADAWIRTTASVVDLGRDWDDEESGDTQYLILQTRWG